MLKRIGITTNDINIFMFQSLGSLKLNLSSLLKILFIIYFCLMRPTINRSDHNDAKTTCLALLLMSFGISNFSLNSLFWVLLVTGTFTPSVLTFRHVSLSNRKKDCTGHVQREAEVSWSPPLKEKPQDTGLDNEVPGRLVTPKGREERKVFHDCTRLFNILEMFYWAVESSLYRLDLEKAELSKLETKHRAEVPLDIHLD